MSGLNNNHRVSCVLPAYNEAESLAATVGKWAATLASCTHEHEIIVVDDGSTDDTAAVLNDLAGRHARLRVVVHGTNRGYGAAIANGFAHAAFPLLFFTDADGQYEPEDVRLLLDRIDTADVVVGYRRRRADPGFRHLLSRGYNFLARRFLDVSLRDLNCAFKLLRRDTFQELGIESVGFSVNTELAASARSAGLTIVEVPVRHRPRGAGRSKVRPFHLLDALYGLVWLRMRRRRSPRREFPLARTAGAGVRLTTHEDVSCRARTGRGMLGSVTRVDAGRTNLVAEPPQSRNAR